MTIFGSPDEVDPPPSDLPAQDLPRLRLDKGTPLVQRYDVAGASGSGELALVEIADSGFNGMQVSYAGLSQVAPEKTPHDLTLLDFGDRACPQGDPQNPKVTPAQSCGHTVIVWNDKAMAMVSTTAPNLDVLAFARDLRPA